MEPASIRLSIIIPAHNEEDHLPKVLASLSTFQSRVDAEVVVVDVGSDDRTVEVARIHGSRIIRTGLVFPGVARNRGVEETSSDMVAFLDGDVVVTEAWANRVLDLMQDPRSLSRTIAGFPYDVRPDPTWLERTWFGSVRAHDVSHISGGNLLVLREDFVSLGCFDESLPTGEDYDLCLRAQKAGFRIWMDESLHTVHLGFPRSALEFIVREGWHGKGDFVSFSRIVTSKVAMATLTFLACIVLVPSGFAVGSFLMSAFGLAGAASVCLISSVSKWRRRGVTQVLAATPIFFLYFLGRSLSVFLPASLLGKWRSN